MKNGLIDRLELDNGQVLEMYDRSRAVAGDRWLVTLSARINVSVKPDYFSEAQAGEPDFREIVGLVGETAAYKYDKTRNFIEGKNKDEVLKELMQNFLDNNLTYISKPDFPRRLILRKYREAVSPTAVWKTW
jgi:hypothetical protein